MENIRVFGRVNVLRKLLVINGSPRNDEISNTYKALQAEIAYFRKNNPGLEVVYFKLPVNLQGCVNCDKCVTYCRVNDDFKSIVEELDTADAMLLGSPVYLDMPTSQVVAFLTRLNCMAENTNREFFRGKEAYLVATSYCSGTKTCIHTMMGACEMLGFTITGRSTREYIKLWSDEKLRGGLNREDVIFLK